MLGYNGTIVRAYPLRGSGPVPPHTLGPASYAVAVIMIIAVAGLGLLIYFKKLKRGLNA